MGTNEIRHAPWDMDEVRNLQRRQANTRFHPYTCVVHSDIPLVPEARGWRCPAKGCDYEQDWAAAADLSGGQEAAIIPASVLGGPVTVHRSGRTAIEG